MNKDEFEFEDEYYWHSCPYQIDINGNYDESYCNCSDEEISRCAEAI